MQILTAGPAAPAGPGLPGSPRAPWGPSEPRPPAVPVSPYRSQKEEKTVNCLFIYRRVTPVINLVDTSIQIIFYWYIEDATTGSIS